MTAEARKPIVWLALALALLAAAALPALEVPPLTGRVVDLADLIDGATEQRIVARLAALEASAGHQIAVLTVPSLEGDPIDDLSIRVVEAWKLGRDDVDDGALLLVARDDRKMRIEVGYGLEPTLTDAMSKRVLDDVMRPRFRAGDFAGGIEAGVDAIIAVLEGSELPAPSQSSSVAGDVPLSGRILMLFLFMSVVGLFSLTALLTPGAGGCFLYLFLMPFWGAFPAGIFSPAVGGVTLLAWIVGYPLLRLLLQRTGAGKRWAKKMSQGRTGRSWSSDRGWRGGFGGFSGGGGGFSGGGFSGGGGSFGGGGSSSSW